MKKIAYIFILCIFFTLPLLARDRAMNPQVIQQAVTANSTTITSTNPGYWWVYSDAKIYVDTETTTANASDPAILATESRDYFPLWKAAATTMTMAAATGTANVTIIITDE
jgi:hypothetical protein